MQTELKEQSDKIKSIEKQIEAANAVQTDTLKMDNSMDAIHTDIADLEANISRQLETMSQQQENLTSQIAHLPAPTVGNEELAFLHNTMEMLQNNVKTLDMKMDELSVAPQGLQSDHASPFGSVWL